MRTYMPTTFDETMVDFGFRLSRKQVIDELHDCMAKLDSATKVEDKIKKLEPLCEKANQLFIQLIDINNPYSKWLESNDN